MPEETWRNRLVRVMWRNGLAKVESGYDLRKKEVPFEGPEVEKHRSWDDEVFWVGPLPVSWSRKVSQKKKKKKKEIALLPLCV